MRCDATQYRVGFGTRENDACGAEVDVGGKEVVQLSAVVQRHRVDFDVIDRHRAGDDRADVVRHQAAAGMHHPLRPGFGAAGVHQPHQLVVGDLELGCGCAGGEPPSEVVPAGRRVQSVRSDRDPGGHVGALGHRLRGGGDEVAFYDEPSDVAVPEDERNLLGGQHEVDRHQHHPGSGGGERQHSVLPAVVRQ